MKMIALSKKMRTITLVGVITLVALIPSLYFFLQYQKTQKLLANPSLATKEEVRSLIDRVGKLMVLPQDEEPTVATVSDPEKLRDKPFFIRAKNGDKVLIYNNAKKAILFDPVANKIVDVAPVTIASPSASVQPTSQSLVKVVLYNGTMVTGLTQTAEKTLKEKIGSLEVVSRDNAKKRDYAKTLVVDLSGNKKEVAKMVAQTLNGEVNLLPEGEAKPASISGQPIDLLVILGKDFVK